MSLLEINTLSNCILLQTPLLKYQYQAVICDVLLLFNILGFLSLCLTKYGFTYQTQLFQAPM